MAEVDFYITKVLYNNNGVIDKVEIRLRSYPITGEYKVKSPRIVSRDFIYDLLTTGKINISTAIIKNKSWSCGDTVGIYGDRYITTDGNKTSRDNLGELPEF